MNGVVAEIPSFDATAGCTTSAMNWETVRVVSSSGRVTGTDTSPLRPRERELERVILSLDARGGGGKSVVGESE